MPTKRQWQSPSGITPEGLPQIVQHCPLSITKTVPRCRLRLSDNVLHRPLNAFSRLTRLLLTGGRQAERQTGRVVERKERGLPDEHHLVGRGMQRPTSPPCVSLCPTTEQRCAALQTISPTAEQRCAALRLLSPTDMQRCGALHPPFPPPWCVIDTTYCDTVHAQHAHWQALAVHRSTRDCT